MSFKLKDLATVCVNAEMNYAIEDIPLDPRFVLKLKSKKKEQVITLLTGMNGVDLYAENIVYIASEKKTLVMVKCEAVRKFFHQNGWTPEDILDSNPLKDKVYS